MYWEHDPRHPVTKVCTKCQEEKSLAEFYLRRKTGRRQNPCRECVRARLRLYYMANREWRRAMMRRYYAANRDRCHDKVARWKRRNRDKVREYRRRDARRHPWKRMVRRTTYLLCRLGLIERPGRCVDCGGAATQHHHLNYDDPFAVVALCRACHLRRHGARDRSSPDS